MEKGKIILLNGVSSSGKTTLAKALQNKLSTPFYLHTFDNYMNGWAEKYIEEKVYESYLKLQPAVNETFKVFSNSGINSIIDNVLLSPFKAMEDFVCKLHDCPVMLVHVTCSIEELQRREKKRGDREIGQGESQLQYLSPRDTYDIVIDTEMNSVEECVEMLIECLNHSENWNAMEILWKELQNEK